MGQTVYLVIMGDGSDGPPDVFSTREKADAFVRECEKLPNPDPFHIEAVMVDAMERARYCTRYSVTLYPDNGDIVPGEPVETLAMADDLGCAFSNRSRVGRDYVFAASCVSQEHANELAREHHHMDLSKGRS